MSAALRNNFRLWMILAAAGMAAVIAVGWLLGASPLLASAAAADETATSAAAQNQVLQIKLAALSRTAAKTDQLTAHAAVLQKAVPASLKPNTFVRRVNEVAALDDVSVQNVTPGDPIAYVLPASLQGVSAAATAAAQPVATPAATATPAPTAGAAPAVPVAPVLAVSDPAITAANFTDVPMTLVVKGTSDGVLQFVKDMQRDERLYLINSYSTSADAVDSSLVTATLNGYIYALKQ